MRKYLLAALFGSLAGSALAADMAVKAPPPAPLPVCTVTSCTGFYAGGSISESGGNFNLVSTGLNGLASNEFGMGADVGYQFWNGQWFFAAEVGGNYSLVQNGTIPGGGNSALWSIDALGKVGYNLLGAIAPTNGPSLPIGLALIAPYAIIGDWTRPWGSGLATGAGIEGWLTNNLTLHVDYIHVNYNNATINPNVMQQTEDMVVGGVDYHFKGL